MARIEMSLTRGEASYLFNLLEGIEMRPLPYLNRAEYGRRNKEILKKLRFACDHRYVTKKTSQLQTA